MAVSKLFERLLALSSAERRPEEDFFTEVVAALLRHHPALFWTWLRPEVKGWLPYDAQTDTVEVETQAWRRKRKEEEPDSKVDLVLRRRRPGGEDVAYVESKVASGEGRDQLLRYAAHLAGEEAVGARLLVYVTRDFDPKDAPAVATLEWKQARWLDFFQALAAAPASDLVREALALMHHLRMNQSQTLTPLDLLAANELPTVFGKLVEALAQVESAELFRRLSGQQRYVGPSIGQLTSHSRLMLRQRTTRSLWGGPATEGLWLLAGFEMNLSTGVPIATVFIETPSEFAEDRQRGVEELYGVFEAMHEGWEPRNVGGPFRRMVRERPLSDFLGDAAIGKLAAFFEGCLKQLTGPPPAPPA